MEKEYKRLIKGIKHYFNKNKIKKAVIGLSGGIDSALALKLVSDAIGKDNITAILMPEKGISSKASVDDAIKLCKILNIKYKIIPINNILNNFKSIGIKQNKDSWINLKPRIRAVILYNFANANKCLVIGTSNKTEMILGYFTKYGDGACDVEVIGDLYKTEVWELSKHLDLPDQIINKKPSAELFRGHSDEKEIGYKYSEIDDMLKGKKKKTEKIKKLVLRNKHKTQAVQVIKK
jgi:NAD+ synthase